MKTSKALIGLCFFGWKYSYVTKVRVYSLKRRSIGGTAKSVDYHPTMLLVDLWKIWLTLYEKLEADSNSYRTYAIIIYKTHFKRKITITTITSQCLISINVITD
jgi:hypothetical protein